MSMSTRLASCWALSLAGSSGEGAREKLSREISFGLSLANFSIEAWVSCRLPATSMMLSITGLAGIAL
jgi:hypothetical protein